MSQRTKYLKIICNLSVAVIFLLGIIFVLPQIIAFFIPFLIAFIFSLIANPIVKFLEKKIKINRRFGSVLIIVLVIAAIVLLCYGAVSLLWTGVKGFSGELPSIVAGAESDVSNAFAELADMLNNTPFLQGVDFSRITTGISEYLANFLTKAEGVDNIAVIGDTAKKIPDIIVNIIICLLATYFFIADREKMTAFLGSHLPDNFKKHTLSLYHQVVDVVGGYFKAQFKIMFVIYIVLAIGLAIIRIDYGWLLGFGIAFLDMLPVFGTGTVLIPWAAIKLLSGDYKIAVGLVVLYAVSFVIHQVIQPKLVGDSVGMEPFAALFFMYIGYRVSSVFGMILAIPIGMILINLVKAGAFDNTISCLKILVQDFNRFRKM